MNYAQIADNYWVAPQIEIADITKLKLEGFDVVVCNRPDGEELNQPTFSDIEAECADQGMEFHFLPMNGPNFSEEQVQTVKSLINAEKKIFAYCRSGNRSSILFNAAIS